MAMSYEYAETSLLCAEEDKSIFDDVDRDIDVDDLEICKRQKHTDEPNLNLTDQIQDHSFMSSLSRGLGLGFGFGFEPMHLQIQSEECLASMVDKETQHLPNLGYLKRLRSGDLDLGARKQAIHWIEKVQSHYNFGPLCVYLAINYLDRFLAAYELPKGRAWMMQLLAVACLSLAAKMEETDVPLSLDLQVGDAKFVFESKTIQRMELLVLSTLKWRMQALTPFSFIDYFLYKTNGDQMPPRTLMLQCIQLILSTIKGIDFLEFRPSEIAAAVAISITEETQVAENSAQAFSNLSHHVQQEKVVKCVELIHDLTWSSRSKGASGSGSTSVPQSPNGVIDAACMSYNKSESETSTPSGSCSNSVHSSPAPAPAPAPPPKRRRLARSLNF
uniref:Uncharacterized protein n=1 Tax=Opuntia streptacantha TaxID=393608 RepID=A0A7C9AR74_OPUST